MLSSFFAPVRQPARQIYNSSSILSGIALQKSLSTSSANLSTKRAMTPLPAAIDRANDFLTFVNASPTPFHAVHEARQRLEKAGFQHIRERDAWSSKCKPGGKYYLTRNGSSLVAFAIGERWKPGNPVAMVGTHTDSCVLRIKPVSKKQNDGFLQVGVETYGGGLWHTWFDRDLSIAGRVMVRSDDGTILQKLIKLDRPILRVPTLAIHLDRQESFTFNKETQLFPIAGLVAAELDRTGGAGKTDSVTDTAQDGEDKPSFAPLKHVSDRHHSHIVELIAQEASVEAAAVTDFEVVLYDTQKACLGGLNNELIFSARLDNLMMTFCAVEGMTESVKSSSTTASDSTIRLISLFDHEEIGSQTSQGADSNLLPAVLRRLSSLPSPRHSTDSEDSYDKLSDADAVSTTAYEQTLATSFLISADMAHSVHPNYPAKYESDHRPAMNAGPVIKVNANARYATNTPGIALLQEVARRSEVPLQLFVVRNDSSCGSTIGPMLAAALGARTLDLGNAQLSMHSIRETGGAWDAEYAVRLFQGFFEHFGELEPMIVVD